MSKGWSGESNRHSFASKGTKTRKRLSPSISFDEYMEYRKGHIGKTTPLDMILQNEYYTDDVLKKQLKELRVNNNFKIGKRYYLKDYVLLEDTSKNKYLIVSQDPKYYLLKSIYNLLEHQKETNTTNIKHEEEIEHILENMNYIIMYIDRHIYDMPHSYEIFSKKTVYIRSKKNTDINISTGLPYLAIFKSAKIKDKKVRQAINKVVKAKGDKIIIIYPDKDNIDAYKTILEYVSMGRYNIDNEKILNIIRHTKTMSGNILRVTLLDLSDADIDSESKEYLIKELKSNRRPSKEFIKFYNN